MENNKYYVFYISDGAYVYERTCGELQAAIDRVEILLKQYGGAKYFVNELPKDFFY
jgi:hypothetical protein